MKRLLILGGALLWTSVTAAPDSTEQTLVQELLAAHADIKTMRCDVRREVDVDGQLKTSLSRVWFERPNRLRVESVSPTPRGIVVDGTTIFKWVKGQAHGVKIRLDEAPKAELIQVQRVPATGQEYLLHVENCPETPLPSKPGFPIRRGYTQSAPLPYTVVSMTAGNRLGRIELFASSAQTNRLLKVDYSGWKEVAQDIWIPCTQETTGYRREGSAVFETLRASSIVVNRDIAPRHFNPKPWAKKVRFVSQEEMAELLEQ